jgi:hypothetical protein
MLWLARAAIVLGRRIAQRQFEEKPRFSFERLPIFWRGNRGGGEIGHESRSIEFHLMNYRLYKARIAAEPQLATLYFPENLHFSRRVNRDGLVRSAIIPVHAQQRHSRRMAGFRETHIIVRQNGRRPWCRRQTFLGGSERCTPLATQTAVIIRHEAARRANQLVCGFFVCPVLLAKIFRFRRRANQIYNSPRPVPWRGVAQRHERGAGCGGRGCAFGRMALRRTEKSCGPDTPTLVSSLRMQVRRRRWQESPVAGEHEGNR